MVFGKKRTHEEDDSETQPPDHVSETQFPHTNTPYETQPQSQKKVESKPLLDEVIFVVAENSTESSSKNVGGAKVWVCKHCKFQFTSSYSRIHTHFFGGQPGKKAEIRRCSALLADREKYTMLLNKVMNAEKVGVSKSIKKSVISKKQNTFSKSPLEQSFGVMERNAVDIKVMRCLCANGMGEIYERMDNMLGEIKDAMKDNVYGMYYPDVESIILARWEKMTIPLHCLGFALTPRFYDTSYLEKLAPGGIARKAPNVDKEVMKGVHDSFVRITENKEEAKMLRAQFATFAMKRGLYALPSAQVDAVTMDAIDWWATYGSETPELAEIAKKVLSQPISSSSAERNWSTYSYIHSVKRNRLNNKRADKLVYIHSNIRLQSRFSDSYKEGPQKKWDMTPEQNYIEGPSSRLEDMEWENLDEDEL